MEQLAPLFLMTMVSYAYFWASPETQSLKERLFVSAPGVTAASIFLIALAIGFSGSHNPAFGTPYLLIFLLPAALTVYSFVVFPGHKLVHLLQLINIPSMLWSIFISSMAATGVWV